MIIGDVAWNILIGVGCGVGGPAVAAIVVVSAQVQHTTLGTGPSLSILTVSALSGCLISSLSTVWSARPKWQKTLRVVLTYAVSGICMASLARISGLA